MSDLLSKYIIKKKKEDVVHSSAFAQAQNKGGIGAASTQSFTERKKIDENRSRIRSYRDAKVVSEQGRESWRIRQEARQMGEDTGFHSIGRSGAGETSADDSAAPNTRGGFRGSRSNIKRTGI